MNGCARWLLAAAAMLLAADAGAQLEVQIVDPQPNYLLYEPIVLKMLVVNGTGRVIELKQSGGRSWLRFLITTGGSMMVRPAQEFSQPPIVLEPGDRARLSFNLTPYYRLREVGAYSVQAVVNVAGLPGDLLSRPARFNVLRGRTLWTREVTAPGVGSPRRFSLISHLARDERQRMDRPYLYAQAESETENLVFGCTKLGPMMQGDRIEALFDASYGWHVLFRSDTQSFIYHQFDMDGKVVERKELVKTATRPHLVPSGGGVELVGGVDRETMKGGDSLSGTQPPEVLAPGRGLHPNAAQPSPDPGAQTPPP